MQKNYFSHLLAALAILLLAFTYIFFRGISEVHQAQQAQLKSLKDFAHKAAFERFSCDLPGIYSDDPIMQVLGDSFYNLDPNYKPTSLAVIPGNLVRIRGPVYLRSDLIKPVTDMINQARIDGHILKINSAHRSFDTQARIFSNPINHTGGDYEIAAEPGFSEHQLGTAIDISAGFNVSQRSVDAGYRWLANNAHKYGFVLSYPDGAQEITGFRYEPWHYRYVGKDLASDLHNSGDLFNEQPEAFYENPLVEGEFVSHSFTSKNFYVTLVSKEEKKILLENNFIGTILSEQELQYVLDESRSDKSFILDRDEESLIFSVIKNKLEVNNSSFDRTQTQANLQTEGRVFVDVITLDNLDASLVVAYSARLDQTNILEEYILTNCR